MLTPSQHIEDYIFPFFKKAKMEKEGKRERSSTRERTKQLLRFCQVCQKVKTFVLKLYILM